MSSRENDRLVAAEVARGVTASQRELMQVLRDKGPGLLLEVAVRALKFPEDIEAPLRELLDRGLVAIQSIGGGQFGGELYTISPLGRRILDLLQDPVLQAATRSATDQRPGPQQPQQQADLLKQEAELLKKLGDAAQAQGDHKKAEEAYERALKITQTLSRRLGVEE